MPLGLDHVHCYLLPSGAGGWTVVDTGLGLPDAGANWGRVLGELDGPVERIVITHFHPDHVGAAADLAGLTGAPVLQGRDDYAQCVRTWGEQRDGILVAGDTLLGSITPNVGLYPASRPDPLADYLGSLERIIELEPRLAL